jgi:hypothetical protein
MTPEQHRERAAQLRSSPYPDMQALAQHHDNLAQMIERRQALASANPATSGPSGRMPPAASTRLTPSEIDSLRQDKRDALARIRELRQHGQSARQAEAVNRFLMTPEQHRQQAEQLRALNTPDALELAQQHDNLAQAIERRQAQAGTTSPEPDIPRKDPAS